MFQALSPRRPRNDLFAIRSFVDGDIALRLKTNRPGLIESILLFKRSSSPQDGGQVRWHYFFRWRAAPGVNKPLFHSRSIVKQVLRLHSMDAFHSMEINHLTTGSDSGFDEQD